MFRRLYQSWLQLLKLMMLERSEPVPLTAGVLIIGSLLWDLDPVREAWRNARLVMNSVKKVTAHHSST